MYAYIYIYIYIYIGREREREREREIIMSRRTASPARARAPRRACTRARLPGPYFIILDYIMTMIMVYHIIVQHVL